MRRVLIQSIRGNELLAKDIISENGIVIMSKGTVVKKEYIPKFISLGIYDLYIEDEYSEGIYIEENIEDTIKEHHQEIMKNIIDKYSFQGYGELEDIKGIADNIIKDILSQPEVLFSISGMRRRSESLYSHSISVCALSVVLALRMKLSKVKVKEIAVGSLLHDIGYNFVTVDFMNNEYDSFTKQEKKELMKHVVHGYTFLEKEKWLSSASKDIVLCHHECADGSGYPFRKTGDKLKIGSKIVSVCDAFDSIVYGFFTSKLKVHDAINYIMSQAGIKYDFNVVNLFLESVAAYPNGSGVLTNEGETGIVLRQNSKFPTRPVIRIIKDNKGAPVTQWVEKDLKQELTLFIRDTVDL